MKLRNSQKASPRQVATARGGAFVLFVLDPLEGPSGPYDFGKDTSHLLMLELHRRGYSVFYSDPSQIFAAPEGVQAKTRRVNPLEGAPYFDFHGEETLPIDRFRLVWIRKDPPVDAVYLYMTQLLSLAKTPAINAPGAIRDWNEKLIILKFPRWTPPTCVTADKHEISRFAAAQGTIALKPLTGFAGRGIRKVSTEDAEALHEQIDAVTQDGTLPVMAQAFLESVRLGEKRVFFLGGRPIGAMKKIPQDGFLANPDHGARLKRTALTSRERNICAEVGPFLKKEGVFFAGVDMIGERLTEINITSPGLLWEWNEVENKNHEREIIDLVEKRFLKR